MFSCIATLQPMPNTSMPGAGHERGDHQRDDLRVEAEHQQRHAEQRAADHPREQRPPQPHAQHDQRHHQQADRLGGEHVAPALDADRAPGASAGPEGEPGARVDAVQHPEAGTTTHSQVLPVKTDQPSRSSRSMPGASCRGRAGRHPHPGEQDGGDQPGERVERQRPARPDATRRAGRPSSGRGRERRRARRTAARWPAGAASRGTSCGTMLSIAGHAERGDRAVGASRTISIQSSACPLITR